ncbi:MAG TPA: hypothetical protein DD669_10840 [Pseudomonas sp.]|nr:hypothetical protein [Pseudomonas sp.]
MWERACSRCILRGLSGEPGRYHREQARSHKLLAQSFCRIPLPAVTTCTLKRGVARSSPASSR